MKKNKKAKIFIFILILLNIILVLGVTVFNKSNILSNNLDFGINAKESSSKIYNKAAISFNSIRKYNSNGHGYLDGISCPENITMSGSTMSGSNISSSMVYENGSFYCAGDYYGDEIRIYYDYTYDDFEKAYYLGEIIDLQKSEETIIVYGNENLLTDAIINTDSANEGVDLSDLFDGNLDDLAFESASKKDTYLEFIFPSESSVGIITLYNDLDAGSKSTNNIFVRLYDENGIEIDVMHIPGTKHMDEIIYDLNYRGLSEDVKSVKILTQGSGYLDLREIEIFSLESTGTEEVWEGINQFSDTDDTIIKFTSEGITGEDNIDDDMNSDNYSVTSIDSIYYPNGYQDDDVIPRKTIFGNLDPGLVFDNIFWTNSQTNAFIEKNSNNNDILNIKAGDVEEAYIKIDLFNHEDYLYDLKILEFDRDTFDNEFSLLPIKSSNGFNLSNYVGYIGEKNGILFLSKNITGDEYLFDFKNKDYGIFISNKSEGNLVYRMTSQTTTGTGIYINPIDDSLDGIIEILLNNITIGGEKNFVGEHFIHTGDK